MSDTTLVEPIVPHKPHRLLCFLLKGPLSFLFNTTQISPTLGPNLAQLHPTDRQERSTTSFQTAKFSRSIVSRAPPRSPSRSTSFSSIKFDDDNVYVVHEEGLKHSSDRLDAGHYQSTPFAEKLIVILYSLRIPIWFGKDVTASDLRIQKASGSLTNAVFFVSCPSNSTLPTLLLRIYGPSTDFLISRSRELHTLHVLSSHYHFGPRIYGTFENGRIEEYFDSSTLTTSDLRDSTLSSWIAARMAELHQVDIATIEDLSFMDANGQVRESHLGVKVNTAVWLKAAKEVLALPAVSDEIRRELDMDAFESEWRDYTSWLMLREKEQGPSPRVFAHNDTQCGNFLRLNIQTTEATEHHQIIVVDFEYASPNPAAFDIANHFHEWTTNYHSDDMPHVLNPALYPTPEQRRNFYSSYITHSTPTRFMAASSRSSEGSNRGRMTSSLSQRIDQLESQVQMWSPASHGQAALWGLVQARESLENQKDGELGFDYVGYACCRMEGFRRELASLFQN